MTYYSQPQPETPARRQQGQVCRLQKTISAVLVAAGSSTRMGFDKLSFDLGGETVLHRSIRAFDQCPQIGEIVLVAGKNRAFVEQQAVGCTKPVQIVAGGATRAESAKNGVLAAHGELVAVHDAARPFVSPAVIAAVLEAAARCGAAAPAVPVKDTIKQAVPGDGKTVPEACLVHSTPDRSTLYAVQTPQCFDRAQYLAALQELAARHRRELGIPILAITGSNGKTTTKELVGRVLSRKFRTAVTQGNLNNHIGVPLTLLAMDRSVEIGVVEMGASHPGEIALLCSIARPDYGLITNIGKAHLEGFGGIEGVMRGKGELLDFLVASGGTAFWLNDSDCLKTMVESRPGLRAISYSAPEAIGTEPFVEARWDGLSVRTRLVGDYNRSNIAAAIAVGLYFGIGRAEIVSAIESYDPDNNRSQKRQTAFNTLISDCYNANPSSMQAALDNFLREADPRPKAVVLGDMGELGPYAAVEHRTVIERLEQGGIEEAYLVGGHFAEAARGSRYRTFADTEALARYLDEHPIRNRLVLVKGSRANRLEKIAEKL